MLAQTWDVVRHGLPKPLQSLTNFEFFTLAELAWCFVCPTFKGVCETTPGLHTPMLWQFLQVALRYCASKWTQDQTESGQRPGRICALLWTKIVTGIWDLSPMSAPPCPVSGHRSQSFLNTDIRTCASRLVAVLISSSNRRLEQRSKTC